LQLIMINKPNVAIIRLKKYFLTIVLILPGQIIQ